MPSFVHFDTDIQSSGLKMKKQLFRVKQLADQRFARAEKTELLTDFLQDAERKVEYISKACGNTSKKMGTLLPGQDAAREKRLKKNAEYVLGQAMQENGNCEDKCLLSTILSDCARIEINLANEALEHETRVEEFVVTPLQKLLDNDVAKLKAKLSKLKLDMDFAETRYHTAQKHSSVNKQTIEEELDEAKQKVAQCTDSLATVMFQQISKEAELAMTIVQYVKLQKAYHESALRILEEKIPELEKNINDSPSKPVYGKSLAEHLRVTQRKVAFPIEFCVCALLRFGMEEEGLFRVAGGASKVRLLKTSFDACGTSPPTLECQDPHIFACALKSYLRDLPDPLMTHALYDDWMEATRKQSSEARLQALKDVVNKLPQANFDNLRYLIKFFSELSRNQEVNKMTPQNIAIVIAPNLIWSHTNETIEMGMNMTAANTYSSIVDSLVNHVEWFFPGEIEFFQTIDRESPLMNGMPSSTALYGGFHSHEWTALSPVEKIPTRGHTRGSSGDSQLISTGIKRTQSSSSLSDHSSPPHGSPKPTARRKNKPAPVPPASGTSPKDPPLGSTPEKPEKPPRPAVPLMPSTLPRPNKKHSDECDVRTAVPSPVENILTVTTDRHQKSGDIISPGIRKQSKDSSENQQNCIVSTSTHQKVSGGGEKVCVESEICGEGSVSLPSTEPAPALLSTNSLGATTIAGTSGCTGKLSDMTEDLQQKNIGNPSIGGCNTAERKNPQRPFPVAAPRSTVNINASNISGTNKEVQNKSSEHTASEDVCSPNSRISIESTKDVETAGGHDGVLLRRPLQSDNGERCNKPAVPERPATLHRPHSSFRGSRQSADSDSSSDKANIDSERPMLERTHVYSVDKQQVSIIQVGGEKDKTVAVPINNNNNNEPVLQKSPYIDVQPFSVPLADKEQCPEKPERPPEPEFANTHVKGEQRKSSHSRAMSEGNIDIEAHKSVMRPQPPHISPQRSGNSPNSPKHRSQRVRPQPRPPPPPDKSKEERVWESTNL